MNARDLVHAETAAMIRDRDRRALDGSDAGRAASVAYQTCVSRMYRLLDAIDALDTPSVVDDTWVRRDPLDHSDHALLTYPDGTVRFRHLCDRTTQGRSVIACAPRLQIGNGHTLTRDPSGRPTVRASVLCDDCGIHGWITDGAWSDA